MNGRQEHTKDLNNRIEIKLRNMPQFIKDWNEVMRANDMEASSRYDYVMKAGRFLSYISENISFITPKDITEKNVMAYYNMIQETTSYSYAYATRCFLNNLLGYLEVRGDCINYMKLITKRGHGKRKVVGNTVDEKKKLLTIEDFKKLYEAVDHATGKNKNRDRAIMYLFMSTGMRREALREINIEDIDFKNKKLTIIDKESTTHIYDLDDGVIAAILIYLNERGATSGYLFESNKKGRISADSIRDMVNKYTYVALGRELSPHKLRSGVCSILYGKTKDIEFVRRFMGHSSVSTTQRYIITDGEERELGSKILGSIRG